MSAQSPVPTWYRAWRIAALIGFLAFAAGTMIMLPGAILGYSLGPKPYQPTPDLSALYQRLISITGVLMVILLAVGFILVVLVLITGAIRFIYLRYGGNKVRNPGVKTGNYVVLVLIGSIVYLVTLALIGPALGSAFFSSSFGTCVVYVSAVVFDDTNGNGVRDVNEAGIPQAKISVLGGYAPMSATTDDTGLAFVRGVEYSCNGFQANTGDASKPSDNKIPSDMFMLSVQSPKGYVPAGEIKSGPYSARWSSNHSPVYVPLRKAD